MGLNALWVNEANISSESEALSSLSLTSKVTLRKVLGLGLKVLDIYLLPRAVVRRNQM